MTPVNPKHCIATGLAKKAEERYLCPFVMYIMYKDDSEGSLKYSFLCHNLGMRQHET